jgi:23S rRNA G2445 N2-methylase RlmL
MSNFVIGIDIDPNKTRQAKENAEIYEVEHKIDFLTANFLKMKNLSGEIVFLNPSTVGYNGSLMPFSMKENLKPELSSLLGKSLQISSCVCLKLPKEVSMDELVAFFNVTLESQEL